MADLASVLDDLRAEGDDTDRIVSDLDADGWATPTPAAGWTVAHQVAHLHWTDNAALLTTRAAAGDDDARAEFDAGLEVAFRDPINFVADAAETLASTPPAELLTRWRAGREDLVDALPTVPAGVKIAWFGPPMSALSMATARLMETWAHGQDIADSLGIRRPPTGRLKNIAHLGVRTRDFAYAVRSQTPPTEEFRIDLTAPNGDIWTWGPDDADQRVTGSAEHFCLLVTQRAHRDDLDLVAVGADATQWLTIAQAFAGAPGAGRAAGARA